MTPSELTVRKVSHRGQVREWTLNPVWVQLDRETTRNSASSGCSWSRADAGCRSPVSSGREEKESFAAALIGSARRGQARPDADGSDLMKSRQKSGGLRSALAA